MHGIDKMMTGDLLSEFHEALEKKEKEDKLAKLMSKVERME